MSERKLLLSLTSYPARIQYVPQVIETLRAQTRPADRILLYLSADQFPGREEDLPEALRGAVSDAQVCLRWVSGDLKPHKKYFYAFREFPEDFIVTVDDDVLYEPTLLEKLWEMHLQYPGAVVAGRTHLITVDSAGQPLPYRLWLRNVLGVPEGPSLQLFAVGIGGVLYDPKLFPQELFREDAIRETCLKADDLWLKAMELKAGIPVVHSDASEFLRIIPGSQESSLYQVNLEQDQNDACLSAIRAWAVRLDGKDPFAQALAGGLLIREGAALYDCLNSERRLLLNRYHEVYLRMRVAEKNKNLQKEKNTRLNAEIVRLNQVVSALQEEVRTLRESSSFKIGSALTRPLHRLRGASGGKEESGAK